MCCHEIHGLLIRKFCPSNQITFVFPLWIVGQQYEFSVSEVLKGLFNRVVVCIMVVFPVCFCGSASFRSRFPEGSRL